MTTIVLAATMADALDVVARQRINDWVYPAIGWHGRVEAVIYVDGWERSRDLVPEYLAEFLPANAPEVNAMTTRQMGAHQEQGALMAQMLLRRERKASRRTIAQVSPEAIAAAADEQPARKRRWWHRGR